MIGGWISVGRGWLVAVVSPSYKGFRYPAEIISHCVWLYHRFPLSFREVEEMMMARGVVVTYETLRQWCRKFGQTYANGLRRRRPRPRDKWHLDEIFIKIHGKSHYLWRAVDQDGNVLDILVTFRRDAKAATRLFRQLLRGLRFVPRVVVTDKVASYGVAHRRLIPSVEHRRSKYLNIGSRTLTSPPDSGTRNETIPIRRWRPTVPFRVQRDITALPTPPPPTARRCLRQEMTSRFGTWNDVVGLPTAS